MKPRPIKLASGDPRFSRFLELVATLYRGEIAARDLRADLGFSTHAEIREELAPLAESGVRISFRNRIRTGRVLVIEDEIPQRFLQAAEDYLLGVYGL
jgi:hypothetical protein